MRRLILAAAAGFLTILVLVSATQFVLLRFFFPTIPAGIDVGGMPPAYLLASGVCSLIFAVMGGCLSAAIGKKYEAPTILGALLLGMAIGGLVMGRGSQPVWYLAIVPVVSAVAAAGAGYRWLGRRPEVAPARQGR